MERSRNLPRLAVAAANVVLWVLGCSSDNPGVAGVACPVGSTPFAAPSLMTTGGGGAKTFADLAPPRDGTSAFAISGGGEDPCRPHADAGIPDAGADGPSDARTF
jgi:hypothetical protein